jgi:outer membrane lipoprotein-sorting protein
MRQAMKKKWMFFIPGNRALWMLALGMSLVACAGISRAQSSSNADLEKVLTQMDAAAAKFHSAQSDFQWDQFQRVVSSTDTQTGVIYFLRSGATTRMAADIQTFNGQPSKKFIVFSDGVLQFYQPQIDQMTLFRAGNKQNQYESYLTLGFGGSGSDLRKSWNIAYQGKETIDGVPTAKLDLVSKTESVRNNFSHVTIWIDPIHASSLKQIWFEPSGDSRTVFYRKIQYNKKIPSSVFKIKTTSKTQVIQK